MFLSRLNEIYGGPEKILPVSGSFWGCLKFFRIMDFTAWLWGWNVRVNGILLLFSFWDVCSADCRSICWARWWPASTTEEATNSVAPHFCIQTKHNAQFLGSLRRRASARNVSFRISLLWPIHIINSVDKTPKLSRNTPTDAAPQFL